jgi:hypothetical protein
VTATNTTSGYTGTADWVCSSTGVWTLQSGATCAADSSSTTTTAVSGSGSCFIAGSKVRLADGSEKNIEDIKAGDKVLTFSEEENLISSNSVLEPLHHAKAKQVLYHYQFSNGRGFVVNDVHPIFVASEGKWVSAAEIADRWLRGEDVRLLDAQKNEVTISYVGRREEVIEVYNMHVDINHNYFVSDVLVHNKMDTMADGIYKSSY